MQQWVVRVSTKKHLQGEQRFLEKDDRTGILFDLLTFYIFRLSSVVNLSIVDYS